MTTDYKQHQKTMLQQISDVAWLVHQGSERVGILNKDVQEHYTFITGKDLVNFNDDSEVREHFGNITLFEEQLDSPAEVHDAYYIRGYLVDYPDPHALEQDHPDYRHDLPLYTKIENGNIYYAAGYYCINFSKGWKYANGPKLATLEKYGYEGPFRDRDQIKQRLRELNRSRNNSEKI